MNNQRPSVGVAQRAKDDYKAREEMPDYSPQTEDETLE